MALGTKNRIDAGPKPALFDRFSSPLGHATDDLRASVRAEIFRLFNTRRLDDGGPVPTDVTGYGIPDLSTFNFANEGRLVRLQNRLEAALGAFEPRLRNPRVIVRAGQDAPDRLAIVIQASLAGERFNTEILLPRRS